MKQGFFLLEGMEFTPPPYDCPACPRLLAFHQQNRVDYPHFYNGPVRSFGGLDAQLLVVGLAPGLKGANQTGRPFTGDYAGLVLYAALQKFGFAHGPYDPGRVVNGQGDGFALHNCRITNAVRCVPPQNKPEPEEIRHCNRFLHAEIAAMPRLRAIVTLGLVSHKAVLMALGKKQSFVAFSHGAVHRLGNFEVFNSYHCSRYNINTGTLTQAMFDGVIARVYEHLEGKPATMPALVV